MPERGGYEEILSIFLESSGFFKLYTGLMDEESSRVKMIRYLYIP